MQNYTSNLRQLIVKHFDLEELRTLCADLGVDYDDLRGEGKTAKARELISYLERLTRLSELADLCKKLRPNVTWLAILEEDISKIALPPHSGVHVLPEASDVLIIESPIHLELVRIPAGEFLMGSDPKKDKDAMEDEQPQHSVYVSEFFIGKYPVSNEQYGAFLDVTGHRVPKHWEGGILPEGKEDHPVVYVSWNDAREFCEWLEAVTKYEFRLPTEAEWEKAARGTDGRIYPWGNRWNKYRCNTKESGIDDTTPVRKFSPGGDSPYGAAEMAGNVWEWCSSIRKPYPYQGADGREDLNAKGYRVVRGGSWKVGHVNARVANRDGGLPDKSYIADCFRVCMGRLHSP